jgi:hypothetical protein
MQSLPTFEMVRAIERDLDREHVERACLREAEGTATPVRKSRRSPLAAIRAVGEWWLRPGEAIPS